jgi:hypothetical protein
MFWEGRTFVSLSNVYSNSVKVWYKNASVLRLMGSCGSISLKLVIEGLPWVWPTRSFNLVECVKRHIALVSVSLMIDAKAFADEFSLNDRAWSVLEQMFHTFAHSPRSGGKLSAANCRLPASFTHIPMKMQETINIYDTILFGRPNPLKKGYLSFHLRGQWT